MKLLDHKKITLEHMIYRREQLRKDLNGRCDVSVWEHYDRYVAAIDRLSNKLAERNDNHE